MYCYEYFTLLEFENTTQMLSRMLLKRYTIADLKYVNKFVFINFKRNYMVLSKMTDYKYTGTIEYVKNRLLNYLTKYITGDSIMVWIRNAKFSEYCL